MVWLNSKGELSYIEWSDDIDGPDLSGGNTIIAESVAGIFKDRSVFPAFIVMDGDESCTEVMGGYRLCTESQEWMNSPWIGLYSPE